MIASGPLLAGQPEAERAEHGERAPHYDEAKASAYMKNQELELSVGIGLGSGRATVYTCDLTHGYIDINGSYRS